jgi:hypothetical protein
MAPMRSGPYRAIRPTMMTRNKEWRLGSNLSGGNGNANLYGP